VEGSQHISNILFCTIVVAMAMLPVVAVTGGVALVPTNANNVAPVAGGVMVTGGTVPLRKVRNVLGAIVEAEAIVTGLGITLLATVSKVAEFKSS